MARGAKNLIASPVYIEPNELENQEWAWQFCKTSSYRGKRGIFSKTISWGLKNQHFGGDSPPPPKIRVNIIGLPWPTNLFKGLHKECFYQIWRHLVMWFKIKLLLRLFLNRHLIICFITNWKVYTYGWKQKLRQSLHFPWLQLDSKMDNELLNSGMVVFRFRPASGLISGS